MKKFIALLLLVLATVGLQAQKIDPMLSSLMSENAAMLSRMRKMKVQGTGDHQTASYIDTMIVKKDMEASFNKDCTVRSVVVIAFLNKGAELPVGELSETGIKVTMHSGSTVIMEVPAEAYDKLSQMKCFESLYASRIYKKSNDISREMTSAAYVTGEKECNQIPTKYDGTGVIVGVIDGSIDFNHAAFRNPEDGTTRIKEAITFANGSSTPIITTGDDIYQLTTMDTSDSHGTHVSAIAAGSDVAGAGVQGMAPKADLILADLGDYLSSARMMSAANEMFRYAERVNKPISINISLGHNADRHDGSNATTRFLHDNVGEGKIVCMSSGNEGDSKLSIVKTLGEAGADGYQFRFVYDTKDFTGNNCALYKEGVRLLFYADTNTLSGEFVAVNKKTGDVFSLEDKPLRDSNGNATYLNPSKDTSNGVSITVNRLFAMHFDEEDLLLGLLLKGDEGTKVTVIDSRDAANLCGRETYPVLADFEEGDASMSINVMACDDAIISVGAYVQRPKYTNINGRIFSNSSNIDLGRIATFSSYGIDDNGIARPDILAPGMWSSSAFSIYDNTVFTNKQLDFNTPYGKRVTHFFTAEELGNNYTRPSGYGVLVGTSMASPVATGIVALWLQANPRLTPADVRSIARATCLNDEWTTDVSNIPSGDLTQAGMGKIDALRGIKYIENQKAGSEVCQLEEHITFNNGIATYSSKYPLIFDMSSTVKAYVADNCDDDVLWLSRIDLAPAGTGLLLVDKEGGNGDYYVPIAPSAPEIGTNYFIGTADGAVTLDNEGEAYVLSKFDGVVGFYQNAAGLTVPKNKAYLKLPDTSGVNARALSYKFVTKDDDDTVIEDFINIPDSELGLRPGNRYEVDGIVTPKVTNYGSPAIYNLQGQRVGNTYRGIIIINGKKVIVN